LKDQEVSIFVKKFYTMPGVMMRRLGYIGNTLGIIEDMVKLPKEVAYEAKF